MHPIFVEGVCTWETNSSGLNMQFLFIYLFNHLNVLLRVSVSITVQIEGKQSQLTSLTCGSPPFSLWFHFTFLFHHDNFKAGNACFFISICRGGMGKISENMPAINMKFCYGQRSAAQSSAKFWEVSTFSPAEHDVAYQHMVTGGRTAVGVGASFSHYSFKWRDNPDWVTSNILWALVNDIC